MTANRIVVSGATTAITRRTSFRKAFLAPWHPMVRDIWLYALADAQRETGVAIHHGVLVINHEHLEVTPSSDNLPEFIHRVHRDVSCALHTLLAHERYDTPRELWDGREPHCMRLMDAEAQATHCIYQHINCVAAGLVERPEQMPDFAFDLGLLKNGHIEIARPPVFFSERRPSELRVHVTPHPLLYRAFGGDLARLVHHMRRLSEDAIRAIRAGRTRPVAGARRVTRIHPWDEPRTLRETGGRPVPSYRVGARGIVGWLDDMACARETGGLRRRYRKVFVARRSGDLSEVFPFGTYGMRVLHGAPVEPECAPDALVSRPGPLLVDVQAELAREDELRRSLRAGSVELVQEVSRALVDEAAQIVEHVELELDHDARPPEASAKDAPPESGEPRAAVVVRHRFARPPEGRPAAKRLVILRDRRRGRPPGSGTHGSDPPV